MKSTYKISIFFITGTSGSGKSTLTHYLKTLLPKDRYIVYDFDEDGVPENADAKWRQETTKNWLIKALKNNRLHKSTVICGVSVPSEVLNSLTKIDIPVYFGLLKINDDLIKKRLQKRGWNDIRIKDNINWAHYLESEVLQQKDHLIIESFPETLPATIANTFIQWIVSFK